MVMTPQQIGLVKASWQQVLPISATAADIFYTKLFASDPALRSLFRGDMAVQGKKLMSMINTAVVSLDRLDAIVPTIKDLGRRHGGYGVKSQDYDTVAGALLSTLHEGLGEAFTDDVKQAWVTAYTVLATTMKDAAARGHS
jgi:hemoglobin-like flavoprotein